MARLLELRVGPAADALDRFEAAWNRAAEGRPARPLHVLSIPNLPLFVKTLSPARWELMRTLKENGPSSVYELAKRLQRDYKNVHTDVSQLAALGLIERTSGGVAVTWRRVRAELELG